MLKSNTTCLISLLMLMNERLVIGSGSVNYFPNFPNFIGLVYFE